MKISRILLYNIFHTKKDIKHLIFGKQVYILVDGIWSLARGWRKVDADALRYKLGDEQGTIFDRGYWQFVESKEKWPDRVVVSKNLDLLREKYPTHNLGPFKRMGEYVPDRYPRSREFRQYIGLDTGEEIEELL